MNATSTPARNADVVNSYDRVTIGFHWVTALLVVLLFGSAWLWNNVPRDLRWHRPLESFHVSFGIAFAVVLALRLVWRWVGGRRLNPAGGRVAGLLSRLVHFALYVLLAVQVALGFALRWAQGEAFSFFGLFSIPQVLAPDRALARTVAGLHDYVGWTIIIVAAGHAVAAIIHHHMLKDGVLARMLPAVESKFSRRNPAAR